MIESQEQVPFRLTRNLTTFMTPFLVDGIFSSAVTAANSCLLGNQAGISHIDVMKNYLSLFIRDDLVAYNATKSPITSDDQQKQLERQLKDKVAANVSNILKRIVGLMPPSGEQVRSFPFLASPCLPLCLLAAACRAVALLQLALARASVLCHAHSAWCLRHCQAGRPPMPVNAKIHQLVKSATAKNKLCLMPPAWAPWF